MLVSLRCWQITERKQEMRLNIVGETSLVVLHLVPLALNWLQGLDLGIVTDTMIGADQDQDQAADILIPESRLPSE